MPTSREQRSLFGEILDWMLAPLLLLWPMSVALTWLVAQSIANRPYDREMAEVARTMSRQLTVDAARANVIVPPNVADLLRTDDEDRAWFQVRGLRGELVAGEPALPQPTDLSGTGSEVQFRDDTLHDEAVRVAWLWLAVPGPVTGQIAGQAGGERAALVQVAETLDKRSRLATEIIKGVILPQFVILPLAVLLVWFALARGIKPLSELQQRIRRRDSNDLSPIEERDVPEEVAPLVSSINDLLARLDQSIGAQKHFLADAAHQLKTPLAGLRTQAELAAREIDSGRSDAQSLKHSLHLISLSSQRAAHMVNQLLAMARAENKEQALRQTEVDLAELAIETVRDFVPRAMEKRIDLGYEGPEGAEGMTSARLIGQPVLIREMVRNLVDNALQYTPAGGTVTARVMADPFGQVVVLQVEDTGPGIPAAERDLVFQAFYRALGTNVDGSGLGLAIVHEVALQHGAEVSITDAISRPLPGAGPGALFTVRFPVRSSV